MREHWIENELTRLAGQCRERTLRDFTPQTDGSLLDNQGRRLLNFSSNDYLGFAHHPEIIRAAVESHQQYGAGATASRLVCGNHKLYSEFEQQLAEFKRYPASLLFGSGFLANIGTISSLVGPGDQVIADKLSHASILDGVKLSGAQLVRFRHNDPEHCRYRLAQCPPKGRRLVVTESVFSMDGDCAPIRELAELCEREGAMFMVDEAHATGVFGENGRGLVHALGLQSHTTVSMGTLSKSFGACGGFIACSALLKRYVINTARSFIYTTGLPPGVLGAARKAISLLEQHPGLGAQLLAAADRLRTLLTAAGLDTGASESQIIPVLVGDGKKTVALSQRILDAGILAIAIRPPTVPQGAARLRLSVSLVHSPPDIEKAAGVIIQCAKQERLL
ncbi:MAG: 8-amino-7-oxononanoate synthase [Pirellulaceae bacterium]